MDLRINQSAPATLVTTPPGQANVVEVKSTSGLTTYKLVMQVQKSFLFSKGFWGFVATEAAAIGAVIGMYQTGHIASLQDGLTAAGIVGGPVFAFIGRVKATGPLGVSGTESVEAK